MSATKAAPQMNRKQTRAQVDGQIQKSISIYLQAALCQCFERMFGKRTLIESHALRWSDVSLRDDPVTGNERQFLKVGSSRAYQDYDQEQREHPLQPGAVRLNKFFAKYRPSVAKKAHSLLIDPVFIAFIIVVLQLMLFGIIHDKIALLWSIIVIVVQTLRILTWILRMNCRLIYLLFVQTLQIFTWILRMNCRLIYLLFVETLRIFTWILRMNCRLIYLLFRSLSLRAP